MKKAVIFLFTSCCGLAVQLSWAQQTSADVVTILRASLAAQTGQKVIQDVTLTGNAESIAGSDDERVPFAFKGTLSGSTRTDINLSSGTLSELRTVDSAGPAGTWSRGDGQQHSVAGHNLITDPAWCSPVLLLERLVSNSAALVSYIGTEDGLVHFRSVQPAPAGTPATSAPLVQHLGQMDLYLDPKTFLPVRLSFSTHADDNALLDIPVRVEFSNYQTVYGVTQPMRVQRYVNGSLALDLRIENVTVNSGLSSASLLN
jgi:hypothetical protein